MTKDRLILIGVIVVAATSLATLSGCGERQVSTTVPPPNAPAKVTPTQQGEAPPQSTASPMATRTAGAADAGSGCSDGSQCLSGNCVGAVCCDAAACPTGERCDIPDAWGQCQPASEAGGGCWYPDHCQSGFCVDGACCTVAACQEGESCNVAGHAGACTVRPTPTITSTATASRTRAPTRTPIPTAALRVGPAAGDAGERVTIAVTLDDGGASVAGTQNDLHVDGVNLTIAARPDGSPDCAVEPTIGKPATAFAFLPPGCTAACTGVRALVLAVDNIDTIADGSVLYRCGIDIADEAPDGVYLIRIDHVVVSDPRGRGITAVGIDSEVFVGDVPATPTGTPTPAAFPARLQADTVVTSPGQPATVSVTLHASGVVVAATQNDLRFDSLHTPIAARVNGRPDCTVNPDINKAATSFVFQPIGCSGTACTAIRALVLATDNLDTIPDGSMLYTCTVTVAADATASYSLAFSGVILSTPGGEQVPDAGAVDGAIIIGG